MGDVTNAHKKPALGDITNAALKKEIEKPIAKRPLSRKPSTVTVPKTTATVESKPLASKLTTTNSVVIPKKRPSEAVAPRRTLTQSTSSTSLVQKTNARVARRRVEETTEQIVEAPRKKQKVEQKQDWDDLDAVDANDPLMVSDYVVEIFDYMRELEVPNALWMKLTTGQNDAKSSVYEESSPFRMAHAWNSSRLAY